MSSRKIEDLTPRMQEKIVSFEAELEQRFPGQFKRSCTYRSQAEQDALWKRGRVPLDEVNAAYAAVGMPAITEAENRHQVTWKRVSIHTGREAVDYFVQRDGKYCNDLKIDTDGDKVDDWKEFGQIAEAHGLEWGEVGSTTPMFRTYNGGHEMKRLLLGLLAVLLLTGCATANFTKSPDGTVTVSYFRFLTTSNEITASVGDAKVESKGQKIDAATLANILNAVGK